MILKTVDTIALSDAIGFLRDRLNSILLGKPDKIELVLACLLAQGHLLLDDLPGLGKTTLAKAIAACFGAKFARVQCTPDLLPTDVTGFNLFNQKTREFEFHAGPVFADILLADELNRTTPRTQSALFEAMAERQVTIDGVSRTLPPTFFVIATQNPIDSHGAYPLPEAQLDRFAMKLAIGYPSPEAQLEILSAANRASSFSTVEPGRSLSVEDLHRLQKKVHETHIEPRIQRYIVDISNRTHQHDMVVLGVSPRGMLLWQQVAKAWAVLNGRDFVIPDDVQEIACPVLGVRLITTNPNVSSVIESIISNVEVPTYR
jgi:MoxR-like ATPase